LLGLLGLLLGSTRLHLGEHVILVHGSHSSNLVRLGCLRFLHVNPELLFHNFFIRGTGESGNTISQWYVPPGLRR
jgi:hypothetical protein